MFFRCKVKVEKKKKKERKTSEEFFVIPIILEDVAFENPEDEIYYLGHIWILSAPCDKIAENFAIVNYA